MAHRQHRPQRVEASPRDLAPERFDVMSAGLEPGGVNPFTARVFTEFGIDAGKPRSKGTEPIIGREHFDEVAKFREVRHRIKSRLASWLRGQPTVKAGFAG